MSRNAIRLAFGTSADDLPAFVGYIVSRKKGWRASSFMTEPSGRGI